MKEFNYRQFLAEGLLFKEEEEAAADQWWNSLDPQYKREVCQEICGPRELKAAVAEWYGYIGSEHLSAADCEECFDEIWNELAPDEKQHYMDSDNQQQPLEEANSAEYPKAHAWLEKHPEVEVYTNVADAIGEETEKPEVDAMEAGFMFISELESILNSSDKYDDDYILSCCEAGIIDDPSVNPDSADYNY